METMRKGFGRGVARLFLVAGLWLVCLAASCLHGAQETPDAALTAAEVLGVLGVGGSETNGTVVVRSQRQLAEAAENPGVDLILCLTPLEITQPVDLKDKDIVAGPRIFEFSQGGRLLGGRSISRVARHARYPIFMDAASGFWVWYTGKVTYNGKNYAPLPGQGTPPSVLGAWNNQERDITMWSQYHEGWYNDAIEAAQNSLPGKSDLADRFGTIRLPVGVITLDRPIYYTAGMKIIGNDGPSSACTTLSVSESFSDPDRLYDIDEDYAIVGVPQNRNNPSRAATAGGGGDGKSVFDCCLRNLRIDTRGRANGILLHASRGSEISNVHVVGGAKGYRAWVIRASDDFKLRNTWADGNFDVCYDLIGSCLNVDIDGSRTNQNPESIGYRISGDNRMGAIRINNANIEHTGIPFVIHNPRGVRITNFSAQGGKEGSPVAVVHLPSSDKWPNHELILQGSVTKGFDRIRIIRGEKTDTWRIKTRRLDNCDFDYDWISSKWAGVHFILRED
jgi:hypothetical protein